MTSLMPSFLITVWPRSILQLESWSIKRKNARVLDTSQVMPPILQWQVENNLQTFCKNNKVSVRWGWLQFCIAQRSRRSLFESKNLLSDWERGIRKPGGPALRLADPCGKEWYPSHCLITTAVDCSGLT